MIFYDRIIESAGNYVREYGYGNAVSVMDAKGIQHYDCPLGTGDGSLMGYVSLALGKPFVVLNDALDGSNRRFIACHELYHAENDTGLLSHGLLLGDTFNPYVSDECEINANMFAAEFMLPDDEVLLLIKELNSFGGCASALGVHPALFAYKLNLLSYKGYPIPPQYTDLDALAAAKLP